MRRGQLAASVLRNGHKPVTRAIEILFLCLGAASCGSSTGGETTGNNQPPPPPPVTTGSLTVVGGGAGTGSGQVTSSPAGISCSITNGVASGTCSATFSIGAVVQLQVALGTLTGWSGDCAGASACQITMSANRQVTANFLFIADPIIVLKTTKPVVVADRIQQTIFVDYSIQNGGGGTLAPTVSNTNPASWLQLSVLNGNTLRATINAVGLLAYSEDLSPYVASVTLSAPGATSVPLSLKFAKSFDIPAGMAATVVRFHQNSNNLAAPPPPTAFAQINLLDARTNTAIPAKIDAVDPPNQNWLEPPTINALGQLELRVQQQSDLHVPFGNLPSSNNPLGTPIRIKITAANGSTTCPAFAVPPDPTCQVFVYYDADPFPRLLLRPWGLQLTPASPTQTADIEVQNPTTLMLTPTVLSHDCGSRLASQPTIAGTQSFNLTKITVSGNFTGFKDDSTFRCKVVIRGEYFTSSTTTAADTTSLTLTFTKPSADVITPGYRDLNILATAGAASPPADSITLNNLGPNKINVSAPTFAGASVGGFAACPAGLLVAPVLNGSTIGKGDVAKIGVRVNPIGQAAQTCGATLHLTSTTNGVAAQDIPVVVRLKAP